MTRDSYPAAGLQRRQDRCTAVAALAVLLLGSNLAWAGPFAAAVVHFAPGRNAGFGADRLPDVVLGPPRGAGELEGSLDVLSLGDGGSIVLRFDPPVICDGPGPDFTVFENPFHAGGHGGPVFIEVGIVAVSQDGESFVEFPYDPVTFAGLAGRTPVYSHPDNGVDPRDPAVSGGDSFDLAEVGLEWAAYVRITDPGDAIPDPGNRIPPGDTAGFDLDAIAAIHTCTVSTLPTPTPSASPTPSLLVAPTPSPAPSTATQTVVPSPTPTNAATSTPTTTGLVPSPTSTVPPTATPAPLPGDLNDDGVVDEADLQLLLGALFSSVDVPLSQLDVNGDGHLSAADFTALIELLPPSGQPLLQRRGARSAAVNRRGQSAARRDGRR